MDKTAQRFREFGMLLDASTANNELLSAIQIRIEQETRLLGELEDIRDELGILRLVLEEQKEVAEDLETLLGHPESVGDIEGARRDKGSTLKDNRVNTSHLTRIERMEIATKRSIESVSTIWTIV